MTDITERKENEEKLRKIDQMKSEFLSNVSHELRTPLQSIGGFTKLLLAGQVPDPNIQQEFLQIIDRETLHLGNLINSLLDMSRLEAGRFQINRRPTPVRDIIIDSINSFHSLAREKDITLRENIPELLPEMEVDGERLRQVVINLLSNAIKFSNPGGLVIVKAEKRTASCCSRSPTTASAFKEADIKHLFERFYRAEGELVRGGTGLGLYISRQIIEAHGGRIWAESALGEGSTFSFTLPLNAKEETAMDNRILVIEDDPATSQAGGLFTPARGLRGAPGLQRPGRHQKGYIGGARPGHTGCDAAGPGRLRDMPPLESGRGHGAAPHPDVLRQGAGDR